MATEQEILSRPRRDRQRGRRRARRPTSSSTSRSSTTSTSTRCRWSRSSSPPRRSSASRSPTTSVKNLRPSATPSLTSQKAGRLTALNADELRDDTEHAARSSSPGSAHDAGRRRRRRRPGRRLLAGRSGVRQLDDGLGRRAAGRIAAPVAVDPPDVMDRVEARKLDRIRAARRSSPRARRGPTPGHPRSTAERLGVVDRHRHRRRH